MANFSDLPTEIISLIISYITIYPAPPPPYCGFNQICLVNKLFNEIATPLLYQELVLKYNFLPNFRTAKFEGLSSPTNRGLQHIRSIKIWNNAWEIEMRYPNPYQQYGSTRASQLLGATQAAISKAITRFLDSIGEDQLISFSAENCRLISKMSLRPQRRLRHLSVEPEALGMWPNHICRSFGVVPTGWENFKTIDMKFEEEYSEGPKNRLESFTFPDIYNEEGLVAIAGALLLNSGSLRSIDISLDHNPVRLASDNADWIEALERQLSMCRGFDLDLRKIRFKSMEKLDSISITSFRDFNNLFRRVPEFLDPSGIKNLRLVHCSPAQNLLDSLLPNFYCLKTLHLISSCDLSFLDKFLMQLNPILQSLHIVVDDSMYFPTQSSILRHAATLEILWIDIYSRIGGRRMLSIVDHSREEKRMDYETIMKLESLKQVAFAIPPELMRQMRPHPKLRVIRVLNYQEQHYTLAVMTLSSMFDEVGRNFLPLKILSFGEVEDGSLDETMYKFYHIELYKDDESENTRAKGNLDRLLRYPTHTTSSDSTGEHQNPALSARISFSNDDSAKPYLHAISFAEARWRYPDLKILVSEVRDDLWLS